MIDINKMRRLAQAATPGPWVGCGPTFGESLPKYLNEVVVDREGDEDDVYSICNAPIGLDEEHSADMAFIAEANPLAIEELLDRLEAAEKGHDALRAALQHEADCVEAAKAEIDALRAMIAAIEQQEPARLVTPTALLVAVADLIAQMEIVSRVGFVDTPDDKDSCAAFCVAEGSWLELMSCVESLASALAAAPKQETK